MDEECVVIGAGPAGLGTAAMLRRRGVQALLVDRADAVATSWRARYDGFRLNTSSWFSYLPGQRFPRTADRWPSRDELVAYYQSYAERNGLRFRGGTEVERVDRSDGGWVLRTSGGQIDTRYVVIATGKYRTPIIPSWPGRESFEGEVIHSTEYRNAQPYAGREVLVIGPGASGFEIATQVASADGSKVWLAVRTPPHIVRRNVGPLPVDLFAVLGRRLPVPVVDRLGKIIRRLTIGDLTGYGLQTPPDGVYTRLKRTGMVGTVDGPYLDSVKSGAVTVVPALERFDGRAVILADGSRLNPATVIAATGFHRDLEPLVGHLGVLTRDGHPAAHGARTHPDAPNLHFIGFSEPLSGNLRELRLVAKRIAHAIASTSSNP